MSWSHIVIEQYPESNEVQLPEQMLVVSEQPQVEELGLIARGRERATEFMSSVGEHLPTPPHKLTAGLAVAAIAIGGATEYASHSNEAEAATNKPVTSTSVRNMVTGLSPFTKRSILSPKKGTVTAYKLDLIGNCTKNENNPYLNEFKDLPTKEKYYYCGGGHHTYDYSPGPPEGIYRKKIDHFSSRIADGLGLDTSTLGKVKSIHANKQKAIVDYARPSPDQLSDNPIKEIVIKGRHHRFIHYK